MGGGSWRGLTPPTRARPAASSFGRTSCTSPGPGSTGRSASVREASGPTARPSTLPCELLGQRSRQEHLADVFVDDEGEHDGARDGKEAPGIRGGEEERHEEEAVGDPDEEGPGERAPGRAPGGPEPARRPPRV